MLDLLHLGSGKHKKKPEMIQENETERSVTAESDLDEVLLGLVDKG